jgi:protocatechuate 3,4-dioxygenase beta subunit
MIVFLLLFLAAPRQSPVPQSSSISGIVTRADGTTPIAGARVVLRKDQSVRSETDYGTQTSSDGHFAFRDVAAGRYRLSVKQPGYIDAEFGQKRPNRPGSILDLSRPLTVSDIRIQMTAGSVVSGRVYDEDGQALETVQIQLIQPRYQADGRILPLLVTAGTTNDLGEYRLYWVPPGTYYALATSFVRGTQTDPALIEQFEGAESMFMPTFYPNSLDESQAIPIKVEAGNELRGIDVAMTRVRGVHVRGQVIDGTTGQPVPGSRVSIQVKNKGWPNFVPTISALTTVAGEFDLRRVAPGTKTVSAIMTLPGGRQASSYVDLQVGERDIPDLRLVLQPPPTISGRVIFEKNDTHGGALSFSEMNGTAVYGVAVMPNGTFNLPSIPPGVYRLSLNSFGDGYFIRTASSGSRDVLREGIDTTGGTPEALEIRMALSTAIVEGTVTDELSNPTSGAQVVLVPTADRVTRPDLFRNSVTDQRGQFMFRGIPPGSYKVFAWMDIEPGIYHDLDFLERYEGFGTALQVGDSGTVSTNIKVIP